MIDCEECEEKQDLEQRLAEAKAEIVRLKKVIDTVREPGLNLRETFDHAVGVVRAQLDDAETENKRWGEWSQQVGGWYKEINDKLGVAVEALERCSGLGPHGAAEQALAKIRDMGSSGNTGVTVVEASEPGDPTQQDCECDREAGRMCLFHRQQTMDDMIAVVSEITIAGFQELPPGGVGKISTIDAIDPTPCKCGCARSGYGAKAPVLIQCVKMTGMECHCPECQPWLTDSSR